MDPQYGEKFGEDSWKPHFLVFCYGYRFRSVEIDFSHNIATLKNNSDVYNWNAYVGHNVTPIPIHYALLTIPIDAM
jgi:hypothetical protein